MFIKNKILLLAKSFIPPILFTIKTYIKNGSIYTFKNNFKSWEEAASKKNIKNSYITREQEYNLYKLRKTLNTTECISHNYVGAVFISTFPKKKLKILEIGAGYSSVQKNVNYTTDKKIYSVIMENENFVNINKKNKEKYTKYIKDLGEINLKTIDICFVNNSLNFLKNYKDILTKINNNKIKYIILSNNYLSNLRYSIYTHQKNFNPNLVANINSIHEIIKILTKYKIIFKNMVINYRPKIIQSALPDKNLFKVDLIFKIKN